MLMQDNQPNAVLNESIMVAMAQQTVSYRMETPKQVKTTTITAVTQQGVPNNHPTDRSSAEGKFGWAPFTQTSVPYLMRFEEKYVSLKMMHCIYNWYSKYLTNEIYNYFVVKSYLMTGVEAKLLNEINYVHTDNFFGKKTFTTNDLLITLKEAISICNFLQFTYEKLVLKDSKTQICGFMRINLQNCIPYVWYQYKRYVPLFYIDGNSQYLKDRALKVKDWPLAYLKLCCKVHGVKKPVYTEKYMTVVDLELVKKFFPPNTPFEECWPVQNMAQCLLQQKPSVPQLDQTSSNGNRTSSARPNIPIENPPPYSAIKRKLAKLAPNYTAPPPYKSVLKSSGKQKIQVSEYSYPSDTRPYSIAKTQFGNKNLNLCVNLMPFDFTTRLATIEEIVNVLGIPKEVFLKAIEFLNCDIYLPNTYQRQLLGSCMVYFTEGLLEVGNLVKSLDIIRNTCVRLSSRKT